MEKFKFFAVAFPILVVLLLGKALPCSSVTCDPTKLSSCLAAIQGSSPPSHACCSGLKVQRSCFCLYMKNPTLRMMIMSPKSRKIASYCRVPFPRC
ncbi:non-specific lipid-transfer protein 2 [Nymphaea colorata]|nr:non-specific lipid-transfer protein 2 [Nymphaea colorata]